MDKVTSISLKQQWAHFDVSAMTVMWSKNSCMSTGDKAELLFLPLWFAYSYNWKKCQISGRDEWKWRHNFFPVHVLWMPELNPRTLVKNVVLEFDMYPKHFPDFLPLLPLLRGVSTLLPSSTAGPGPIRVCHRAVPTFDTWALTKILGSLQRWWASDSSHRKELSILAKTHRERKDVWCSFFRMSNQVTGPEGNSAKNKDCPGGEPSSHSGGHMGWLEIDK